MLRQIVEDRRFSLVDLILVIISGAIGIIKPESGSWFLLIALLPWIFRLMAGKFPFERTPFDGLVGVFLITAIVGYFTGYNGFAAYEKFYFILVSILLYFSLSGQPRENIGAISTILFTLGVCISIYFFLTRDFGGSPADMEDKINISSWWMMHRPQLKWTPIPSGYVPGLAFVTTSFAIQRLTDSNKPPGSLLKFVVIFGFMIVLCAIIATTSLSVWFAFVGAIAVWGLWKVFDLAGINRSPQSLFPWLILIYLALVLALLYTIGPAASSTPNFFGNNSRLEVLSRSTYLLLDYPILGGGLASFPGLYSQYILGIPYYYFPNSYNLFLDVAIEQGLAGGFVYLGLYLVCIVQVAQKIQNNASVVRSWLALFVLIFVLIHGTVQDYLYNSAGTILLFVPVGMSVLLTRDFVSNVSVRAANITKRWELFPVFLSIILFVGILLNRNKLVSIWYANLGAVQLAQVELAGFPETGWAGLGIIPNLQAADISLQTSLQLDPANLTANYRLGLIHMLKRDYTRASKHLEIAYVQSPRHRGIIKSLGYCYLWMGENDKARVLLATIPEASGELDAYYWWWENQGREDLSKQAYIMLKQLNSTTTQP